jgi:hypothetical protein
LGKNDLFTSAKYDLVGALTVRAADSTVLGAVPVRISAK